MLLFDAETDGWQLRSGGAWQVVADPVMGGVSEGQAEQAVLLGRSCIRLTGTVRLENNGGFVQLAADLRPAPPAARGLQLDVLGPPQQYNIHLRTTRIQRPWQSFRATFETTGSWQTLQVEWEAFEAHRTEAAFSPEELRRIGLVAIGRAFSPDLALARLAYLT